MLPRIDGTGEGGAVASKKNGKAGAIIIGPALVIGGLMALWQNEGRFDYYQAAKEATVIVAPYESPVDAIAYTSSLRTDIPIEGEYVTRFTGYHRVDRSAEIYSWEEDTDSDGNTTWSRGWHSRLESNSRNRGLSQRLSSTRLFPPRYELGELEIDPRSIRFVDDSVTIPASQLELSGAGAALGLRRSGDYLYLDKGGSDELGDERVRYRAIPNAVTVSYFGSIAGGRGVARQFEQKDGIIAQVIGDDGILHHLVNGDRETALAKIKADLRMKTWLVRIGGTVAVTFGFFIFFSVFASLLYRIPLLGGVVQGGVFLFSAVLGVTLSLVTILTGLLFHNPVTVALPIAAIIGGAIWFQRRSRSAGRHARAALDRRVAEQRKAAAQVAPPPLPPAPPLAASGGPVATPAPPPAPPEPALSDEEILEHTFVNLAVLALAEGQLDKRENRFLTRWGQDNGISAERMKALFEKARRDPPESHRATREDLEILALMAMADGVISTHEWDFLWKIAERLGMKPKELRTLLLAIERGDDEAMAAPTPA